MLWFRKILLMFPAVFLLPCVPCWSLCGCVYVFIWALDSNHPPPATVTYTLVSHSLLKTLQYINSDSSLQTLPDYSVCLHGTHAIQKSDFCMFLMLQFCSVLHHERFGNYFTSHCPSSVFVVRRLPNTSPPKHNMLYRL